MDVIRNGKWAYEIHNKDRNQNPLARWGWWLRAHPYAKIAITWTAAIAWIATWNLLIPWVIAWVNYISRKMWDATLEQMGAEHRAVRGLQWENEKYIRLQDIWDNPGDYGENRMQRMRMWYEARRQVRLYGRTTHRDVMVDIEPAIQWLQNALVTGNGLEALLADALCRLDSYQYTGHNFFAQQNDQRMEENMNKLQNLVQSWANSLNLSLDQIRWTEWYTTIHNHLNQRYEETRQSFMKERLYLWVRHASIYALTYAWFYHLFHLGSASEMKLNQEIIDWFALNNVEQAKLETWLQDNAWSNWFSQSTQTPTKFWEELYSIKTDAWLSPNEFNGMKNTFMEHLARDMQEAWKREILENAKNIALSPSDPAYTNAIESMTNLGICTQIDWAVILDTIKQIQADPNYLTSSAMTWEKMRMTAEYCYYFLEKGTDSAWWLLGASFHEQKNRIPLIAWSLWLPVFWNTFLQDVKWARKEVPVYTPPVRQTTEQVITPQGEVQQRAVPHVDPIVTDPRKHAINDGIIDESAIAGYTWT